MTQTHEYIKSQISVYADTVTKRKGKYYICPICGSGTGPHKTPAGSIKGNFFHCFSCHFHGDIFDLIGVVENMPKKDSFKRAYELFGAVQDINMANDTIHTRKGFKEPHSASGAHVQKNQALPGPSRQIQNTDNADYTVYFKACNSRAGETDYFSLRGISREVVDRYSLGYDAAWTHPKTPGVDPMEIVIIPTGTSTYSTRSVEKKEYRKVGPSTIFNATALNAPDPVFVVEGEFDALSVIEAGGQAIGLGSTGNKDKFIQLCKENPPKKPLILCLDNDMAGQSAQADISARLTASKIPFLEVDLSGGYKDPNEYLTHATGAFKAAVARAVEASLAYEQKKADRELEKKEAEKNSYLAMSASNYVSAFYGEINKNANTPAIPTGFSLLDEALDGGLYEGLYIIGALSSLGKTTFTLQLADQIARQGVDVLIFSLEMSRYELMAKSVSRLTFERGEAKSAKTTRGILAGGKWKNYSKEDISLIARSVDEYEGYSDKIFIHEGIGNIGVLEVREAVKKHVYYTGKTPVVVIDYLQILAPFDVRATDKQNTDKAVLELKRISRDYKAPVIAISSFNRDNYTSPVNMASFKESGAVEYSSDVLLGLQLDGMDELSQSESKKSESIAKIEALKSADPRKAQLKILKNRNGQTGISVFYDYFTKFNAFREISHERRSTEIFKRNIV